MKIKTIEKKEYYKTLDKNEKKVASHFADWLISVQLHVAHTYILVWTGLNAIGMPWKTNKQRGFVISFGTQVYLQLALIANKKFDRFL